MPALVKVEASEGEVLFEGEFSEAALQEIAVRDKVGDVIFAAKTSLSDIGQMVRRCVTDLLGPLDDLTKSRRDGGSLSSAVIELGVSVSGEGNIVVAKGSTKANIKVTLTWDYN